jgi:predicted nuclease of predicted toxin-antitoxin system
MKVLIDMNLSPGLAAVISRAGHEAVHWSEVGDPSATDHEIMAFARENDYIVLTNDLDFGAILASTQGVKPSVVQVRADDVRPGAIGQAVIDTLRQASAELHSGALVTLDAGRTRIRVLPFPSRSE